MKVRSGSADGVCGEIPALCAASVDREGVARVQARRKIAAGDPCPTCPARAADLAGVVEGQPGDLDTARPAQPENQVVAVGTQLDLQVALRFSEQEQLDDLELPESVERAGGAFGAGSP